MREDTPEQALWRRLVVQTLDVQNDSSGSKCQWAIVIKIGRKRNCEEVYRGGDAITAVSLCLLKECMYYLYKISISCMPGGEQCWFFTCRHITSVEFVGYLMHPEAAGESFYPSPGALPPSHLRRSVSSATRSSLGIIHLPHMMFVKFM